jgi:hypothetical protein
MAWKTLAVSGEWFIIYKENMVWVQKFDVLPTCSSSRVFNKAHSPQCRLNLEALERFCSKDNTHIQMNSMQVAARYISERTFLVEQLNIKS